MTKLMHSILGEMRRIDRRPHASVRWRISAHETDGTRAASLGASSVLYRQGDVWHLLVPLIFSSGFHAVERVAILVNDLLHGKTVARTRTSSIDLIPPLFDRCFNGFADVFAVTV
jgi:hypothetical protein